MKQREARRDEPEGDRLALASEGVTRLLDIVTQEVSLVNRAANRRRWLVRKGSAMNQRELIDNGDGTFAAPTETDPPASAEEGEVEATIEKQLALPKAVKDAVHSAVMTAHGRAVKLGELVKAMGEDDSVEGMPAPLSAELKAMASAVRSIAARYPAPKKKGEEEGEEGEASDAEATEVDAEKQEHAIAAGLKAKVLAAAQDATKRLEALAKLIESAEESDEVGEALPAAVAQELENVAALFDAVNMTYPSPKAAKAEGEGERPHVEADAQGAPEGEETTEKASPSSVLEEARNVIGVVMSKLQPGKAVDEDSYQRLDKLRALLKSSMPKKADDKADDDGESQDKASVEKAGARMAQARRKRFEEAIKSLLTLFKEVMPSKELGKFPHLVVKKSAAETEAEDLRERLAKAEGDLAESRKALAELKDRPVPSQVEPVDGGASQETPEVVWPLDLNAE